MALFNTFLACQSLLDWQSTVYNNNNNNMGTEHIHHKSQLN